MTQPVCEITQGRIRSFRDRLLRWHAHHGRHQLPWQQRRDPYAVWVSEIMLQQTRVDTVIPYYQAFMQRFPTLEALARAPLDQVLAHWSGLGYYARARHLHAAAREVIHHHQGHLPDTLEALTALPGIGRSTAGAILSLALDRPHAILDGNVKRVLARHFAVPGWPGRPQVQARLWALSETLTPRRRAGTFNQAMMDLGALVCTRTAPRCDHCPLHRSCIARRQERQAELPEPRPQRRRPLRSRQLLLVHDGTGRWLMERRPPRGIWGGLWSFPLLHPEQDARHWLRTTLGIHGHPETAPPPRRHAFTHFQLELHPRRLRAEKPDTAPVDGQRWLWYNPSRPAAGGLAAPVQALLQELASTVVDSTPHTTQDLP